MTIQSEIGQLGEELASSYLTEKGYEILERNWRWSKSELDIIAKKDEVLVFVEVKAKSYTYYGDPAESIGPKKERMIYEGAAAYMRQVAHEWEFRFDIITVIFSQQFEPKIEHFEDAFFPGI